MPHFASLGHFFPHITCFTCLFWFSFLFVGIFFVLFLFLFVCLTLETEKELSRLGGRDDELGGAEEGEA